MLSHPVVGWRGRTCLKQTKKRHCFSLKYLGWSGFLTNVFSTILAVLTHCSSEMKCSSQGPALVLVIACYTTSGVNDRENTKINWFLGCCFNASHNNVRSTVEISAIILYWLYTYCYHLECILHSRSTSRKRPEKNKALPIKVTILYPTCCMSSKELLGRLRRSSDNLKHHCFKLP